MDESNKTTWGTRVYATNYVRENNITIKPNVIFQVVSGGQSNITIATNEIEITISLETYNKLKEIK